MTEDANPAIAFVRSDLFPFEGDFRVKVLADPVLPEPPRWGEDGTDCRMCSAPDDDFLWVDDRWRLGTIGDLAFPLALSLQPREHFDSPDLPDDLAAELGILLVRIERAMLGLGDFGRIHFAKWGDGAAHLHWWIMAREKGVLQQRGFFLTLWALSLPLPPADVVKRRADAVVDALMEHGGRRPTVAAS